jgi:hypothetical protein
MGVFVPSIILNVGRGVGLEAMLITIGFGVIGWEGEQFMLFNMEGCLDFADFDPFPPFIFDFEVSMHMPPLLFILLLPPFPDFEDSLLIPFFDFDGDAAPSDGLVDEAAGRLVRIIIIIIIIILIFEGFIFVGGVITPGLRGGFIILGSVILLGFTGRCSAVIIPVIAGTHLLALFLPFPFPVQLCAPLPLPFPVRSRLWLGKSIDETRSDSFLYDSSWYTRFDSFTSVLRAPLSGSCSVWSEGVARTSSALAMIPLSAAPPPSLPLSPLPRLPSDSSPGKLSLPVS